MSWPRMTLSKVLACSAMLNKQYTGSSESTAHYFHAHLLSNYFLLSACPLLNAYFFAVSCYKCMCLKTSAYNMSCDDHMTHSMSFAIQIETHLCHRASHGAALIHKGVFSSCHLIPRPYILQRGKEGLADIVRPHTMG